MEVMWTGWQVTEEQVHADLQLGKFEWDHPRLYQSTPKVNEAVDCFTDAYAACKVLVETHLPPKLHGDFPQRLTRGGWMGYKDSPLCDAQL
jgi:hypothetical protein